MEFLFQVESAEGSLRRFFLSAERPLVVGRGAACDIRLADPSVSRRHALLEVRDGGVWVVDLDSSNGVYVNGRRVSRAVLGPGDVLTLGNSRLSCRPSEPALWAAVQGLATAAPDAGSPPRTPEEVQGAGPFWMTHFAASAVGDERAHLGLAAVYRLSDLLSEEVEARAVLEPVLETVFQVTGADRAAILVRGDREDAGCEDAEVVVARSRTGEPLRPGAWISRTIVREVLRRGVAAWSRDAQADERFRGGASIEIQGIRSVLCAPVKTSRRLVGVLYADTLGRPDAFAEAHLALLAAIGNQAGVALHRARLLHEVEELFFDMVRTVVAAIDAKDGYTHRHSERVAAFALKLARALGVTAAEQESVQLCGLLHDVGKIGVPDSILNKPGPLSETERLAMERHPLHGVRILSNIRSPRIRAILPGVKHHHERWNGSGYPDGLAGEEIPYVARVIGVADALDALTSKRSYRYGLSLESTLALLRQEAGTKWDPRIVECALDLHASDALLVPWEPGFERVRSGVLVA